MQLQRSGCKHFAFLPSGILVVEPNPALLTARVQLLLAADYFVATSNHALPASEMQRIDVRVAVLSENLGILAVVKLAQEVRLFYPGAAILIVGPGSPEIDEQFYDEAINSNCRPDQLLSVLFRLTRQSSDQLVPSSGRGGSHPRSLAGLDWMSLHNGPAESDPSKEPISDTDKPATGFDVPADENSPHMV